MATKAPGGKKTEMVETRVDAAEGPLMDSMSLAVKKMIARSKERGYVTYDELNAVLPPEQMSSEQIEDTLALLNEMGINVVESEEPEEATPHAEEPESVVVVDGDDEVDARGGGNLDDADIGRTDDPVRMY
ncbi:MAG: RNA polymerase sigma factor RpoD, partial [Rhodospirillaceae bacterium]|nr:RNA polymerase sigma factor RpoD [Rhodospirillaceae bacterium]